jgi:hypothetical protein
VTDQHYIPRNDIDFKVDGGAVTVFVGDGALHYQWQKYLGEYDPENRNADMQVEIYSMDVVLEGANTNARVVREEQQGYYETYYLAHTSGAVANTFNKITYKDIYPKIDWVLYSSHGRLKYDFIVHPGGNPADIKLRYEGATSLSLKEGNVTAITPLGSITEKKPYSYLAASKTEVPSSFVLKDNVLSFDVQPSDATLVIDPVLEWGTYVGGPFNEEAEGVSTDDALNVYVAGRTSSSTNIAIGSVHKLVLGGPQDAYVVKINRFGQRVWGTYYGGESQDFAFHIAGPVNGRLFIVGATRSTAANSIASAGAYKETHAGGLDAIYFLACLTDAGQRAWGTYYPAKFETEGHVACDNNGNVYIAGETRSDTGVATPGSFQSVYGGIMDAFVVKFNKDGQRLWGSYYGTPFAEELGCIAVDPSGNLVVAGTTGSPNWLVSPNAHQPSKSGGPDAFVMKFDSLGILLYSTYYGGNGNDHPEGLACDKEGNFYLSGATQSSTNIASANAHQTVFNAQTDGFVVKFNAAGVRQWATYYGGEGVDMAYSVAADKDLNVYIAGSTLSTLDIASANAHSAAHGGSMDGFMAKFREDGTREWGSYYGGAGYDHIWDITTDGINNAIICGRASSTSGIANPAGYQPALSGASDGFVAQFYDTTVFINEPFNDTLLCVPQQFFMPYTVQYIFNVGNEFRAQLSDANGSFANPVNVGYFKANQSASIPVTIPLNTPPGDGYRIRIVSSSPYYVSKDNGVDIRITDAVSVSVAGLTILCGNDSLKLTITDTVAGATYNWLTPQGMTHTGPMIYAAKASALGSGNYIITANRNGCIGNDTIAVTVKPAPSATEITNNSPVCAGSPLKLTAEGNIPSSYTWYGPEGLVVNSDIMLINEAKAVHRALYRLLLTSDGCVSDTIPVFADVVDLDVWIDPSPLVYPGDSLILVGNSNRIDSVTYSWTGPAGFTSNDKVAMMADITAAQRGDYTLTVTRGSCSASATIYQRLSEQLVFTITPNPNKGIFTISGNTQENQVVNMEIVDAMGKTLYRDATTTKNKRFTKSIDLGGRLSNGVYVLRLDVKGKERDVRFVVSD